MLLSSLEVDLDTYKALASPTASESTRIQNLQHSISTHEVAMVSLKKEFERQSEELLTSQSEARRLRDLLDKKVSAIICRLKVKPYYYLHMVILVSV